MDIVLGNDKVGRNTVEVVSKPSIGFKVPR
jgi:hypothetical protein